jgi:hypothetical protein
MVCTLKIFPAFERQLKTIFKKYPNSQQDINTKIEDLVKNPLQGDVYPGFNPLIVRKIRMGLRAYKIGDRSGLRLIFLHSQEKLVVAPLVIYKKGAYGREHEVKEMIINTLKEIIADL